MTRSRSLAASLLLLAACTGEKPAADSSAVTTTASNGVVLGDTAATRGARAPSASPVTPPGAVRAVVPAPAGTVPNGATGAPATVSPANGAAAATVDTGRGAGAATTPGATATQQSAPAPTQLAAQPGAAAPARPPIPYSAGERLAYDVKFSSIDVGDAVMEVLGLENVRGRQALHIRFSVKGGTILYKVNDRYESWIDTTNLVSLRHWQQIDEGRYERERRYEIMPEIGVYKENDKPNQPTVAEPLDDGSFFFFLRTIPLEVGKTYSFDRYFKPDRNPVTVTVVRRERIKVPAGTFDAIVLHPSIKAKGIFGEGGQAEIWLADDSSKIMLQMKSKLKIGSLNLFLKQIRRGS
ncbi:MAG: DUF3108 domain-containing protein [Gemmatimonadaceae bacterium]